MEEWELQSAERFCCACGSRKQVNGGTLILDHSFFISTKAEITPPGFDEVATFDHLLVPELEFERIPSV